MEKFAHFATIGAAIVAAAALWIGLGQFTETQKVARANLELQTITLNMQMKAWKIDQESKAVDLFLRFNELKEEAAKLPTTGSSASYWRNNRLLSITETVYRFTEGDEGWEKTVDSMLVEQANFIKSVEFFCDTYSESFWRRVEKIHGKVKCKQLPQKK